jgi:glutamine phosphoribosylpyrophosphate amidotransferase
MCGVIGYIGHDVDQTLLDRLIYESEIRGIHDSRHWSERNKVLSKYKGKYNMLGIHHTRYSTSGKTSQPLVVDGKVLAFNGVIHMGTKKEMEKEFKIKMSSDNDGEILLQKCSTPERVLDFISFNKCSFAGVMLFGSRFVAMRNECRPLWMHKTSNEVIIASTRDIFIRAGVSKNLTQLDPLKIYEW